MSISFLDRILTFIYKESYEKIQPEVTGISHAASCVIISNPGELDLDNSTYKL